MIAEIEESLSRLLSTSDLLDEARFAKRAASLEMLEVEILDPLRRWLEVDHSPAPPSHDRLRRMLARGEELRRRLDEVDEVLLRRVRSDVRGGLRRGELRNTFVHYAGGGVATRSRLGYDELDDFVAGIFLPPPVPEASRPLEPGMVFYQPTPARVILELADKARPEEGTRFLDIGSGLGLVPILVNLLTGARTVGIEVDPSYHRYASARARDLGLADEVEFRQEDAREADFETADIIFLYTPFTGDMLEEVLARLRESAREDVRIFSYGPCTQTLVREAWLEPVGAAGRPDILAMFVRARADRAMNSR